MLALKALECMALAAIALYGVGYWFVRLWGLAGFPVYWTVPVSLVLGEASLSLAVQVLLFARVDTKLFLPFLGFVALAAGAAGCAVSIRGRHSVAKPHFGPTERFLLALIACSVIVNFAIAASPSTKIDELFYHMLLPKRIVADGGLRFCLLPVQQAILPQMHYQILLSIGHALGVPDIGNLASLGFSLALLAALAGNTFEATGHTGYSLLIAAAAAAGLHTSVWHTASGAYALGDLATFLAGVALLRPFADRIGGPRYAGLVSTLCCVAASTKLPLWPMAAAGTALGVLRTAPFQGTSGRRAAVVAGALTPWAVLHLPLLLWTWHSSGSPWGPAGAGLFGPSVYTPAVAKVLAALGRSSGAADLAPNIVPWLPPLFWAAVPYLLLRIRTAPVGDRILTVVFCLQAALIAAFFSVEFRYLGGLEYIALFAAAALYFPRAPVAVLKWMVPALACTCVVPWVALQWYYGRPFLQVSSGILSRDAFLSRYVAFHRDFQQLDRLLPARSVLYSEKDDQEPWFYAPRPVILTMADWDGKRPVYLFDWEQDGTPAEPLRPRAPPGDCREVVYRNDHAIITAYRTPGRPAETGTLMVRRCAADIPLVGGDPEQ